MEKRQQALRNLALKLNASGTAEVLDEQKLYKDSYGFIKLQAYAPKTQNTAAPVCTAFCTTQDEFGVEKISTNNYKLLYVGEFELEGLGYLLFECYLPKEFTKTVTPQGGLKITLNYYDTAPTVDTSGNPVPDNNGVPKRHITSLLVSSRYTTTVYPGGWNNEDIELKINSAEAAQIGENMRNIAELQSDFIGLRNYLDDGAGGLIDEQERATAAEEALGERIDGVEVELESIRNLGHFAGTFDNYKTAQQSGNTTVPTNKSTFPQGLTVNDFVGVRYDETHKGLATRYIVEAIAPNGNITWGYDIAYSTDITGKMDNRPAANENNFVSFDSQGNSKDSGYKGTDIDRAQATADEAKQIALNRTNSKVFDTYADMIVWLSNPVNTASLVPGASLYIIDPTAPDYWWTGTEAEEEHDKTDLSIFYNKGEIDAMLAQTRQGLIDTYQLEKTVKTPDLSAQRVLTLYKAEYDALPYKDPNTLYLVPDDNEGLGDEDLEAKVNSLEARLAALEQIIGGLL